ncbi:hypothetical protein PTI98_010850 [Pleurotus ostreatus]|nr:hypothetical protein PTI98_010850 [Pleurotus ostreatus]
MERTTSETRRYSVNVRLKDGKSLFQHSPDSGPPATTDSFHSNSRKIHFDHIKPAGRPLKQAPASMGEAYRYLLNPSSPKWTNNRVAMVIINCALVMALWVCLSHTQNQGMLYVFSEVLWDLVGDCYVHGIMDGSFALQAKLEDVYTFSIV